jgi:predicted MFS family arabinose efflux permease
MGMLFTPALGVYVVTAQGYDLHFLISAAITAVSFLLLLPICEPQRQSLSQPDTPSLREVARMRLVWVAAFGITGLAVAYGAVLGFLAPFADELGLAATGGYFSTFAVAMMVAQASAGWLSDRVGRRIVAVPGMVLVLPAMLVLAAARSNGALLVAGALFGLSWGLARAGIDTTVVDAATSEARGTAVGFLYTCFDIGVGVGSFGLGVVARAQSYAAAFYVAAAWAAVALTGYLVWGRRKR